MLQDLRLFALLMFLLPFAAFARNSVFTDPAPISVPAKLSAAEVDQVVKDVLTSHRWAVKPVEDGKLEALYLRRNLMAKINVRYDGKGINIGYLDSAGLDYEIEGDKRSIHPTYKKWIIRLVKSIETRLVQAEFVK